MTPDDFVLPFQFESCAVRGRLVRLGPALDLILHQHAYPPAVGRLLSEAMALGVALATSLNYEGVFTLQAKSDGAVRLLVADVTHDGGIRAYAQFDETKLAAAQAGAKLLGKGYLAFTVDQQLKQDRYQGLVELNGDSLAEAVQHYFRQSEQLPTGVVVAVQRDAQQRWHGGCLLLQHMPREGGHAHVSDTAIEDDWHRAMLLLDTCTPEELTDPALPAEDLLFRLFHEEGVRIYDRLALRPQCRCSLERVTAMLRSLPRAEIEELAVNGLVSVTCEFCNRSYEFDRNRREEIYGKEKAEDRDQESEG